MSKIRPSSERVQYSGGSNIRILNRCGVSVPGHLLSAVIDVARKTHGFFKNGSQRPMSEYVADLCYDASIRLIHLSAQSGLKSALKDIYLVKAFDVPGSGGEEYHRFDNISFFGVHHVAVLEFKDFMVVVDVTAAQLYQADDKLKNTEVLLVIFNQADAKEQLARAYQGGIWSGWSSYRAFLSGK